MKSLKSRIKRLEMAKKNSKGISIILVSTALGSEYHDLKEAKEKYGERPDLKYVVTYAP